jgi:hypothetical protein
LKNIAIITSEVLLFTPDADVEDKK